MHPIIQVLQSSSQLFHDLIASQAYHHQALLLFSVILVVLVAAAAARRSSSASSSSSDVHACPPPSPPGLPVIGHMHLVGANPHVSLAGLDREHGDGGLMLLHLGQVRNLVVSSPRAAEAVLRTHDHVFASRPPSAVADILLSGASDVALAPYGGYWRQARKLVTTHLLSARKVSSLRRAREEEAALVVAKLHTAAEARAAVDMSELLNSFANDVICRVVSGKFYREEGRNGLFRELIAGNTAQFGGFSLEDYFPSFAKAGVLTSVVYAKARRLKKRWDELLDAIIDEHEAKRSPSSSLLRDHGEQDKEEEDEEEADFVDVLLSLQQEYNLTKENVKVILMDMFAAGTDTSYIVLEFALAELIRKPHLMTKLQAEVTKNTPKGKKMVDDDDLSNMTYLKAIVKETLRLHPPVPLLLPRISMSKCNVNGYTIPAGTRVVVNVWALGRDTRSWEKAEEFMPERFMVDNGDTANVDFRGKDFRFVPFGAGRRICPGINFGLASVEIMLANLVYCFDWELPTGMEKEDVDMTDVFGLTMCRKEKLYLVPRPRDVKSA